MFHELNVTNSSQHLFHRTLQKIGVYYMILIFGLGFIGNSISCFIFTRSKLRRLGCSSYLTALSLSDNGYLLCLAIIWLENVRIYIFHYNGICQATVYLTTVFSSLSVWFTLAFTTERFVVVAYPLKRHYYRSTTRARVVIFCLTVIAGVLYSSSLWTNGIEIINATTTVLPVYGSRCVTIREWLKFTRRMNICDVFLTFILPFIGIVTFNLLIIYKSGNYDRLLEKNHIQSSSAGLKNLVKHRLKRSTYHKRITRMLLIISSTFLLLNTPMHVLKIYYFFFSPPNVDDKTSNESIIEQFTFYLFYTNFSINFFLYSLCGKNFRTSLSTLFHFRTLTTKKVKGVDDGMGITENHLYNNPNNSSTASHEQMTTTIGGGDQRLRNDSKRYLSATIKYHHNTKQKKKSLKVELIPSLQSHYSQLSVK
ncbi:unnamed protein product [Didymodactylos carnosus]|uniref:G-protein coupled receptors family 1 profile domain-containing protein n=1 Tax=Didymodactylos carnosus TaxID=1234261 RepID=A0A813VK93_9BILA|nr:unnamed protein product [Didymodactylos carnosus]CAF0837850.1 unnamed protein product [Didymodactylos carnosus]CAF3510503.1 unnamed protein product [Didymodactylos carnosus]CAF3625101.1 unnamed protein product [Didymodactylos carnosus]